MISISVQIESSLNHPYCPFTTPSSDLTSVLVRQLWYGRWAFSGICGFSFLAEIMCCSCIEVIVAIFLPPLAVLSHTGCTIDLFINVILTICGYIPGVIHAIYVICSDRGQQAGVRVTTNVNVAQPSIPMYQPAAGYQPVQPPPAPVYYPEPSAAPPVYYPDPYQKY
ncbi:unnamed protein product [Cylicocyclus nassatus]|uniref:Uncharacterized protein n=1 Tax=Cylicocyclus nassatus TaxID=53992 RepID=A0AA36H6T6_CYLNA|nr:unnamed protein product [Cylicocyclus nassatus]